MDIYGKWESSYYKFFYHFFIKREMDLQSNLIIPPFLMELSNFDKIVQNIKKLCLS